MTLYDEALALSKLSELKDKNNKDEKLISDIYELTKGLVDLYIESYNLKDNEHIDDIRQILAEALLISIRDYSMDMMVSFSVFAYFKMDNILEEQREYLKTNNNMSLDQIYADIEHYENLDSLEDLDEIKTSDLKRVTERLQDIDLDKISIADTLASVDLKRLLRVLTNDEKIRVLKSFGLNDDVIYSIIHSLALDEKKFNKKCIY